MKDGESRTRTPREHVIARPIIVVNGKETRCDHYWDLCDMLHVGDAYIAPSGEGTMAYVVTRIDETGVYGRLMSGRVTRSKGVTQNRNKKGKT